MMRKFLHLALFWQLIWLIAVASGRKLGYNYQAASGDRRFAGLIDGEATGFSATQLQQQQQQQEHLARQLLDNGFNKEFYTYAAPDEDFADREATDHIASLLKRNLRVLFIKSPEQQGLTNAALQLARQVSEQRTAIYVLTKQGDIAQLAQRLQSEQQSQRQAHKPEVHFVKYRTPEDAVRAQQLIQQQFDALGGSSHSSDEGVAPVLDFSTAPTQALAQAVPAASPQDRYLPAA